MYITRAAEKTVREISASFPVMIVTGPRQVGKTTMLQNLDANRKYVTLDDPILREFAASDPALFLQRYEPPVLIDEIQYAPGLLPHIKMAVDKRKQNGLYWLTGSQIFHLMKGVGESLAGRTGIINLPALSHDELTGETRPFQPDAPAIQAREKTAPPLALMDLYQRIYRGCMPALAVNSALRPESFYYAYVQTYLQRDIRDLTQVGDELAFIRFLTAVAARTGQQLNYADMARDTGVSAPTAKQWLSMLVSTGIVYLLEPYYNNALKRIIKSPKIYMMDTGLCSYLTRWSGPETLEASAMAGAVFETWAVTELVKSYLNRGIRPPLYYYRDKDGKEIDLLIFSDNTVHPFEIKKSANPGKSAIKQFEVLQQAGLKTGMGGVICMYDNLLPIDETNWLIPVRLL